MQMDKTARAEMVIIVNRILGRAANAAADNPYIDVDAQYWAYS
jgi:hypothetical protein